MPLQLDFFEPARADGNPDRMIRLRGFLERVLRLAERQVLPLLPLRDRIVVAAGVDPARTIRETGIGARAWATDRVDVWIDPAHPWVEAAGEEELLAMLAHELHHCARWTRPGYGTTLGEALVSEGLACVFETGFRGGVPPFWARALDATALRDVEAKARPHYDDRRYDHREWFIGAPERGLPRHTGYSLGFELVARHVHATGRTAAQLVGVPAAAFLERVATAERSLAPEL
ncbi:MAG: DUF2268 domain-containing putative Zn-dependent protease [Burkholderiaceae bacterium]|jgi:uncharacterized protein YjaZ|nr:hypothetical protein [Burkholderiales bacterium]MCZ8339032.1 DUF2268 domain-containing putative Zn-dependent protease [Burkholderiaceae bacterium]